MTIAQIENLIRYVTNAESKATDVLVPLELWQQLIHSLNTDNISGLALIDEQEPKEQILADLQESAKLAAAGQTFPVSQLWEDAISIA
ncbi:hypothetical protein HCU40_18620 (plasmid) [Pseudanabaena biceps]|nr:hypothetical protein [Pseudanabaena biceps]